jgi:hypothetical protein
MSGWTNYSSGSDSEDRLLSLRGFSAIHVRTREEEEVYRGLRSEEAEAIAGRMMAKAGVPAFKAFEGKAFRILDDVQGTSRVFRGDVKGSGCIGWTSTCSKLDSNHNITLRPF